MRSRRSLTIPAWAAVNLVLGYGATFPLLTAVVFSYYARARVWGTVAAPYHEAEAEASVAIIVVLGGLLMALSVGFNRAYRRRFGLRGWHAVGFWAATIAVQLTPFTWFMLGTERTFPELLGKGWLW